MQRINEPKPADPLPRPSFRRNEPSSAAWPDLAPPKVVKPPPPVAIPDSDTDGTEDIDIVYYLGVKTYPILLLPISILCVYV